MTCFITTLSWKSWQLYSLQVGTWCDVKSLSSLVVAAVTVGVVPYMMLSYILRPCILSFYHYDIGLKQGLSHKLEEELFAKRDYWIMPCIFSFLSPLVNLHRLPCNASRGNVEELFNPSKIMKRDCRIIVVNHDANFIDIVLLLAPSPL